MHLYGGGIHFDGAASKLTCLKLFFKRQVRTVEKNRRVFIPAYLLSASYVMREHFDD